MFSSDRVGVIDAIDRSSPLPLYYQLEQLLLHQIEKEDFVPGDALPSETALQEKYGVSRITVRRALSDLASGGSISRQPGRGTFILRTKISDCSEKLGGFVDDMVARGFRVDSQILQCEMQPLSQYVACKLGTDEGRPSLYFQRLVIADGEPIALAEAHFCIGVAPDLPLEELRRDSIYPLLEHKYNIVLRRADRTIEATLATRNEAELLNARPLAPILLTELIVYDDQNRPVGFVKTRYRGDRYKYYHSITR